MVAVWVHVTHDPLVSKSRRTWALIDGVVSGLAGPLGFGLRVSRGLLEVGGSSAFGCCDAPTAPATTGAPPASAIIVGRQAATLAGCLLRPAVCLGRCAAGDLRGRPARVEGTFF